MRLDELIQGLEITLHDSNRGMLRICDISEDSRTVLPSSLFVARPGTIADGARYIASAIDDGADAILTDQALTRPSGCKVWLTTPDVPLALAQLAERFYGSPSSKLKLIGVTGTNGKTSIVHLTQQLLSAADHDCGHIGTVSVRDGKGWAQASMTTPPALELSFSLSTMVEAGFGAAAIEVSSHGLDQKRTAALKFDAAIFTNLTGDHQDYHGSMEAYLAAKARLFESLAPDAVAIVNVDDANADRMIEHCSARVLRCSIKQHPDAHCTARQGAWEANGVLATFTGPWGEINAVMGLLGKFNLLNVLQSIAAAHGVGVKSEDIERTIPTLVAPAGRLERVALENTNNTQPQVYVDYAHTDDALRHALRALRPVAEHLGGKIHVVMGCGGDRDKTKRPRMGAVASELGDVIYITSDNPRREDPDAIVRDVLEGVDRIHAEVHVEVDRGRAIAQAIDHANRGDVVLIAGKGHEEYQMLPDPNVDGGVRRIDFDDRKVAREALVRRYSAGAQSKHLQEVAIP